MSTQLYSRSKKRSNRHARLRTRIRGTKERPRLSVYRSKEHLFVQLIDDAENRTLLALRDTQLPKKTAAAEKQSAGIARAFALGTQIAEEAKKQKISRVVFDRGGYVYHGRVKAVADGARAGGLEF